MKTLKLHKFSFAELQGNVFRRDQWYSLSQGAAMDGGGHR